MEITYTGRGVSLNEEYSANYRDLYVLKTRAKASISKEVRKHWDGETVYDPFKVHVRYNGNFDIDNTVATTKIFVDVLRDRGAVIQDHPKHYKAMSVIFDPTIPVGTFIFKIERYDN